MARTRPRDTQPAGSPPDQPADEEIAPGASVEAELREALKDCDRFLAGHGRVRPRDMLARLAEEAGADEEADRYGEGALIADFEHEVAGLLGKPAAVFMPSGTMAQQIALRCWCERRGLPVVGFHPTCHLELHEEKGYQALHGLRAMLVGAPHRPTALADLEALGEPVAALLLELPLREIGGQLPEWDDLAAQAAWAHDHHVALHMDGARLWEAAPYYDRPYAEIAALFDSVYVSFYKGMGGIAGAVLAGPADFIAQARIWQRRHGGNLVQLYPYVLAARMGLRERLGRFPAYHERALGVARALASVAGTAVKPNPPQTHMMHVYLRGERDRLLAGARDVARTDRVALFGGLRPTDVPDVWFFELALGDAALALTDDEIASYFARVMTGAISA
jgi:threonine aldolase